MILRGNYIFMNGKYSRSQLIETTELILSDNNDRDLKNEQ